MMTMIPASNIPKSPTGDTIQDLLDERGWTVEDLAGKINLTISRTCAIINGQARITEDEAERLSLVLGSTKDFWLKRDATYWERKEN